MATRRYRLTIRHAEPAAWLESLGGPPPGLRPSWPPPGFLPVVVRVGLDEGDGLPTTVDVVAPCTRAELAGLAKHGPTVKALYFHVPAAALAAAVPAIDPANFEA